MSLAFISNIAAFVTMVMWIRHKGKKETMKTVKIATIILLAIGGTFDAVQHGSGNITHLYITKHL